MWGGDRPFHEPAPGPLARQAGSVGSVEKLPDLAAQSLGVVVVALPRQHGGPDRSAQERFFQSHQALGRTPPFEEVELVELIDEHADVLVPYLLSELAGEGGLHLFDGVGAVEELEEEDARRRDEDDLLGELYRIAEPVNTAAVHLHGKYLDRS